MRARATIAVAALLALALLAALWWVGQTAFVRFALDRAVAASHGRLAYEGVEGTLFDGVRVARLGWREAADGGAGVEVRELRVAWRVLALLRRELDLTRVAAARVRVVLAPTAQAATPPASLALPIALRVRDARVAELTLERADAAPIVLRNIELQGRYRAGGYRIERLRAEGEHGSAQLAGEIGDASPYPLSAGASLAARWNSVSAAASLAGTLERIRVSAAASAPAAAPQTQTQTQTQPHAGVVSANLELRPFEPQPLGPVELRADGVDPAALGVAPQLRMRWTGTALARVALPRDGAPLAVSGEAALANEQSGRLAQARLPVSEIAGRFEWSGARLQLDALRATLTGGARVQGNATLDTGRSVELLGRSLPRARFELALRDLDLSVFADAIGATRLTGRALADAGRLEVDLVDAARGGAALAAAATLAGERLSIERAALRAIPGLADGLLEAAGSVELNAPYRAALAGRFARLDPSRAWPALVALARPAQRPAEGGAGPAGPDSPLARLAGSIDGRWALDGPLLPVAGQPSAIELDVVEGRLAGLAARAALRARFDGERVGDALLDAALGQTRLLARGALGASGERLAFELRAPRLAQVAPLLGVEVDGSLTATGELRGTLAAPSTHVQARGSAITLAPGVRIGSVELDATLPRISAALPDERVQLRLRATGLAFGERSVASADVDASGTLRSHVFDAGARAGSIALRLAGRGGHADGRWQGVIDELATSGAVQAKLGRPVEVAIDAGSFSAGESLLEAPFGRLRLTRSAWRDGRFEFAGEAVVERLGELAAALGVAPPAAEIGFDLDALGVEVRADLAGTSADDLSGRLSGRLRSTPAVAAGGEADLTLAAGRLAGNVELRLPSLAFTNRIVGPEWLFDGHVSFAARVAGTLAQPRLDGELRGEQLRLEQREMGWRLDEGTLRARFDGDRLRVDSLTMRSRARGGGSILMRGDAQVATLEGRFDFTADRLVIPIGPGQRIVLSGDASASSQRGRFSLTGSLRADEGRIELAGGDAPKLPQDVVIAGAGSPDGRTAPAGAQRLRIEADLGLDLGENLRVYGSGVDARLTGRLTLRGALPDAPRAFGTVRVREGRYSAYGQQLQITRGRVIFNGPLENPSLDIVALRRDQPVEAGVALTGTVLAPRIRLTSQPEVPDAEKLSWLVLGVPLEGAQGGAQVAALQAAAVTLFGANDGGLSGGLRDALGLDVLTVRSASAAGSLLPSDFGAGGTLPGQFGGGPVASTSAAAAESVVAVGKRLSSRVLLTYEQGLRGTWNLLRIQYDITRRLSLRAQTGTESAVDVLFRQPFD